MYPFERFTEDAKKVLALAQKEAEGSDHAYIGTEHMLLGLLELERGTGHQALVELGIKADPVRETIAKVLDRNKRTIMQRVVPTSRVKKVIEISFQEAARRGQNFINSGHLLVGIVIEGGGIAAHLLREMGADSATVITAVDRLIRISAVQEGDQTVPPGDLERLMQHPRIERLVRTRQDVDVHALVEKLAQPPDAIVRLREQLEQVREQRRDLSRQLQQAEDDWLREITE